MTNLEMHKGDLIKFIRVRLLRVIEEQVTITWFENLVFCNYVAKHNRYIEINKTKVTFNYRKKAP